MYFCGVKVNEFKLSYIVQALEQLLVSVHDSESLVSNQRCARSAPLTALAMCHVPIDICSFPLSGYHCLLITQRAIILTAICLTEHVTFSVSIFRELLACIVEFL